MFSKKVRTVTLIVIATLIASGCMIQPAGITGTTRPILCDETYVERGPAKGDAWGAIAFGIPLSAGGPAYALKRALNKSGGDALIEVTMALTMIMLGPVTIYKTTIKGIAIEIEKKK